MNDVDPNRIITLALLAVALAVVLPVVVLARVMLLSLLDRRRERAAEGRRVTRALPGLGDFTSTDGQLWFGEVDKLQVSIDTRAGPPGEEEVRRVRALIDDLPRIMGAARAYLAARPDSELEAGQLAELRPYELDLQDADEFALGMIIAADDTEVYSVGFRGSEPVTWSIED
jgi:hypothetical protein